MGCCSDDVCRIVALLCSAEVDVESMYKTDRQFVPYKKASTKEN